MMAHHRRSGGGQLRVVLDYEYSTADLIGHGAFALVFKGRTKQTREIVAIKEISLKSVPGRLSTIRQKEISILKEVKHSNVVQLYDYHEDQLHIHLVMEYCNGGDLGDYLQVKQTLSEHSIRHLTNHIANALSSLHQLHIIHRDIKPQNLLLSLPPLPSGNGGTAARKTDRPITDATIKLADFGFARYLTGTDMAATLCGSPLYMAPEILLGEKYDSKADLWSVGTILYQCLTGTAPFLANNPHALKKRYEREKLIAKIPEGTSRYLASLLAGLLKKNRHERLNHEKLSQHPFLADPSIQASGYLVMSPQPPRAKSSPVPIRRHSPSPSPAPYHSHSHSRSPYQGQSPHELFVSPSSGPPSIHPIGSASSLARQQSPYSDVTDHGFIIVDSPHRSSPYSSATSSPHSESYGSCRSHTPSSTGHTPSSSYGSSSMHKFRSLTTPFYQAPPPTSQSSNWSTPSVRPSNVMATNSPPPTHSDQQHHQHQQQRPRSRSNSFNRRLSSDPFSTSGGGGGGYGGVVGGGRSHSHTQSPPFGRLMQLASGGGGGGPPHSLHSPYTSPYGTLSRHTSSSSPSPSQSPSSHPPQGHAPGLAAGGTAGTVGGRGGSRGGMRYSLSAHGSGSKLSSLAEQSEQELTQKQRKNDTSGQEKNKKRVGKRESSSSFSSSSRPSESGGLRIEQLITTSQVLRSDDEEEEEEEEVDFPLSLSLNSSLSSSKTDEQEEATDGEVGGEGGCGSSDMTTPTCKTKFGRGIGSGGGGRRCRSAVGPRANDAPSSHRPLSRQHSQKLSENFHQIHTRAASLSAHQSLLSRSSDSAHLSSSSAALSQYEFQVSLAAEIKPVAPAFQLPPPVSLANETAPQSRLDLLPLPSNSRRPGETFNSGGSTMETRKEMVNIGRGKEEEEEGEVRGCLALLGQAVALVRELVGMAKARQGPIMLLSTELSVSGGVSRAQRHSEQFILYAKAVSVLDSGLRRFQIETAASSLEPDHALHSAEAEAEEIRESCLEKARQVRDEMRNLSTHHLHHHHHFNHPHHQSSSSPLHPSLLSAERLLLLEAMDMCKQAVLGEQARDSKECVKRYRIAKLIFSYLLSDAKTHRDRTILNTYIRSAAGRIQKLTSDS